MQTNSPNLLEVASESTVAPEVFLTTKDGNWSIELSGFSTLESVTYAFYLLRNGVRVANRWYEKCQSTQFKNDGVAGCYKARVFVKQASSGEDVHPPKTFDSAVVIQDGLPYDLCRWNHIPLFERSLSESWGTGTPGDGLHHFTKDDLHVDLLLNGMEKLEKSPAVLVCFSGAITSRSGTSAPFFSGIGIAKKLGFPVISVADPALGFSHKITLGWYVGHSGFHDLPFRIAELLDTFAESTGARLILFGGSGGGFASLLILSLLKTSTASAFVWNPQTSISKYNPHAVKLFLKTAFPSTSPSGDLRYSLESTGVLHDLTSHDSLLTSTRTILYIQNKSDWHTKTHATPFLENLASKRKISEEVVEFNDNSAYWEGNWGEGHAVPPERVIESALVQLLSGKTALDVALTLEKDHASQHGKACKAEP